MHPMDFIQTDLETLREQGLYILIRTIESAQGAWTTVDGERVLNMCSNNYLGFADDERLKEAARRALAEYGVGPAAVRTIAGTMSLHLELEKKLAEFKGCEATISFQSGFNANLATIPALVGKEDAIFSDELNHASIIDGCRLSRAAIIRYPHNDARALGKIMEEQAGRYRRRLVVTDGVFSMDGDIAPLPDLVQVAERYDAMVMVDDAHGEGVLGRGGRGIVDHYGLHGKVDVEVGTLSKAFGVVGGYVAGTRRLIEYLQQKARPFLFSSAVTPADVAACIAAVDILTESTERVDRLWENARYFKEGLRQAGFDIGHSQTPITPVMLGEAKLAGEFSRALFRHRIFAQAIGYPTVPKGRARIRVMLSAAHAREDLDFALEVFRRVGRELGVVS